MRTLHSLLPLLSILATPTLSILPYKGADISSLLVSESLGRTYSTPSGQTLPLEDILVQSGINTVRQRIWVNPSDGNYNLSYNLELAKRAQNAGLKIYLNFHYSDTWADPGKQYTPAAWSNLNEAALNTKLYQYTKDVLDAFAEASIPLEIVSLGNEITPGLLHPTGRLGSGEGAPQVARLLKSASQGVKNSVMTPKPKIMLHIDNGWDWGRQKWWYDAILSTGVFTASDYDVQGLSYYPFYSSSASLSALESSMQNMVQRYGKELMLVETNWPSSCPNPSRPFPADTRGIPISVEGQEVWLKAVARLVEAVPGGKGTGMFYWEPAWIDNPSLGTSCEWNLLVGEDGKAFSSLDVFNEI